MIVLNINIFDLLQGCFYAMVPAIGFAMVFNVPQKHLKYCAIGGAIGYAVKFTMLTYYLPITWATFSACAVVSFYGVLWAKYKMAHPKVITVASVISMVPGVYAYKTMIAIVGLAHNQFDLEVLQIVVENGLKTIFIFGAIAFGLALPSLIYYRRKPVI